MRRVLVVLVSLAALFGVLYAVVNITGGRTERWIVRRSSPSPSSWP
jgi:hypothetical protein